MIDILTLTENNLKKLNLYLKIKKDNKLYDLILGGSLALILQEIIPQREVNDLDVCYFKYFYIPFTVTKKYDSVIQYEIQASNYKFKDFSHEKIDLFIDCKARYFKYQIKLNNNIEWLNLQMPSEIIEAKMIYLNRGVFKHLDDIFCYLNKIKEKNSIFNLNKLNDIEEKNEINNNCTEENIMDIEKENNIIDNETNMHCNY